MLAIDPTSKGFAFAVLEGHGLLIDYAVSPAKSDRDFRARVGTLCVRYKPRILALEREFSSRRRSRAQLRIEQALDEAASRRIATCKVSRKQVQEVLGAHTKHEIAHAITLQFPELEPRLPRVRRFGMTEDERMSIFDAISFALTVLSRL